jgi:hypothetical protein
MDDQLFRLRIQKSMGQLEAAHKLKALRRDLARVKTVLREKDGPGGRVNTFSARHGRVGAGGEALGSKKSSHGHES